MMSFWMVPVSFDRAMPRSSAAAWLFAAADWVGQDYFSPQSLNYVLYLTFLAILVNWFTDPGLSRTVRSGRQSA